MTDQPTGSLGVSPAPSLDVETGQNHIDPFGGNAISVETSRPLNVAQLAAEINRAVGTTMHVAVSFPVPDYPDRTKTMIFVSPSTVAGVADLSARIEQAVTDHVPAEFPDSLPSPPVEVFPVTGMTDRVDLLNPTFVTKLQTGAKVTTAELADALRSILGISPQV